MKEVTILSECPQCNNAWYIDEGDTYKKVKCPYCEKKFKLMVHNKLKESILEWWETEKSEEVADTYNKYNSYDDLPEFVKMVLSKEQYDEDKTK